MDTFTATMIAEGVEPVDTEEGYFSAWQLQGWFGHTASQLIELGHCTYNK